MKALKIIFTLFILFGFNVAFGLDAPKNIILEKATDNSLDLSWDKVDGAGVYSISYGETTASGSIYDNDQAEIFSTNSGTIVDLKSNTKYFIAVKAYDENNNESEYSSEANFSTLKELKIDSIELIDTRNFNIKFNLDLNKNSIVSLNIINTGDDLENIEIENYKIENNLLKIFLTKNLKLNNKYSVTIITLEGENGEIIKTGVDGIIEFKTKDNLQKYGEQKFIDFNSAGTGITKENSNVEANKTEEKEIEEERKINNIEEKIDNKLNSNNKILGGKIIDNKNITEKIAKNKKDLPTTGPTETFLFLIFALIAGGLFMNLRKRTSL